MANMELPSTSVCTGDVWVSVPSNGTTVLTNPNSQHWAPLEDRVAMRVLEVYLEEALTKVRQALE